MASQEHKLFQLLRLSRSCLVSSDLCAMKAHVRTASDASSCGKTHAQTRKRAQMATQVDAGMWNMPGEEQVTAGLGYVCLFVLISLPDQSKPFRHPPRHRPDQEMLTFHMAGWQSSHTAEDLGCVHRGLVRGLSLSRKMYLWLPKLCR